MKVSALARGVLSGERALANSARALSSSKTLQSIEKAVASPTLENLLFGQESISSRFSRNGNFKGAHISEVLSKLKSGELSASNFPIDYVVMDGQYVVGNNRSFWVLKEAGIEPTILRNRTGEAAFENVVKNHLRGCAPSSTIKVRGR